MNADEAMRLGRAAMEQVNFRYDLLGTKNTTELWLSPLNERYTIHLGAPLNNALGMVHIVMAFWWCGFVDVRTFPDPTLIDLKNRAQCLRVMEFLNYINLHSCHRGCCYLSTDTGAITVWERISYRFFEPFPKTLTDAINFEYGCFDDFGDAIKGCADGSLSADDAMTLMEEKWKWWP